MCRGRLPDMRVRDSRPRALVVTLIAVLSGGGALAWLSGEFGRPPAQILPSPDPRLDPAGHVTAQRRGEIEQRFSQGVVMLHARRYDHAVTAFHRVLELAPDLPEAHVNMGFALIGLERYAAARDFFESATALRRGQVNAYYGLAVALEGLNDLSGAIGAMRTFVHLSRADDPFVRKAEAALWEWEARRNAVAAPGAPPRGNFGGQR
ncbi:MAG: tetratricopeptide repeat protein [Betaproteobacteria bacterium]|nr:tetratricopeptide repeat protein [Betaproteobacteria bacterium]